MIFYDKRGLPVDETGGGGDSCVRASLLSICNKGPLSVISWYFTSGLPVRHPVDAPWNNPLNFSRDQMMMMIGGLKAVNDIEKIRKIFWSCFKRLFFCPNFERNHIGSTKYPWPHGFIDINGKKVFKNFDFADYLLPNHWGAMIIGGRLKPMYFLLPICYFFHLLNILFHRYSKHHEVNQFFSECYVYGTLKLMDKIVPNWQSVSAKYWSKRNEIEYHEMLLEKMRSL